MQRPKEKPAKAQRPTGENPYRDAQLIDIGLLERETRHATSWRRAFFAAIAGGFLLLVLALILATKDHTEAVVYREDQSGDIALIGASSHNQTPSDKSVVHQLTIWIEAVRDIPGNDTELINRNATTALYMLSAHSPAFDAYHDFIMESNPKQLSTHGYRRTVTNVEIDNLTALTYRIAWKESLQNGDDGTPQVSTFSGTVTLAQPPAVPADPLIGQYNPAGVYIQSYDMRWSVLKS